MQLLIAEKVLLIVLDDAKGGDQAVWAGEAGLAAALLLDLARHDLLRGSGTELEVVGPEPEHPVLRDAYEALRTAERPRDAKRWVQDLPTRLKPLRGRVARHLVELGVLSEERHRVLGILPVTRYPEVDPVPERELRARLSEVLVGGRAPTEEEALLIGLLEPLGLIDNVVPKEARGAARQRAKELGEQGIVGSAVSDAVRQLQLAVVTGGVLVPMFATVTGGSS
jgi:hypothetical protein